MRIPMIFISCEKKIKYYRCIWMKHDLPEDLSCRRSFDWLSIGLLFYIICNNFKAEYRSIKTMKEGRENYLVRLNSNVFLNKVKLRDAPDDIPGKLFDH